MGVLSSKLLDEEEAPSEFLHEPAPRVNDSLYELHKPEGTPTVQIIFFHGLQLGNYSHAHLTTWESGDGSCIWPQTWLIEQFPGAHVLSVSCNDSEGNSSPANVDIHLIGENLMSDLLQANVGQVPYCPLILVGHSLGGLVIKQVCLQMHEKLHMSRPNEGASLKKFLDNLKGIFYYATPHHGLHPVIYRLADRIKNPFFKSLSTEVGRITSNFDSLRGVHSEWEIAGLGESRPPKQGLFSGMLVVPEASSRGEDYNVVEMADHFSICKPASKSSRSYSKLKNFIDQILQSSERKPVERPVERPPVQRTPVERTPPVIRMPAERSFCNRTHSLLVDRTPLDRTLYNRTPSLPVDRTPLDRTLYNRTPSLPGDRAPYHRTPSFPLDRSFYNRTPSLPVERTLSNRPPSIKKVKMESSSSQNHSKELEEREDNVDVSVDASMDGDAFEWYDDPITWEKMCDPVMCSDGRTYDRWTIVDQKLRRSPYDRSITAFGILCDDISTRSRLFKAFPQQETKFHQRRKQYREEALRQARARPLDFENAVEKLSNVLKWLPVDQECQRELYKIGA